MNRRRFLKTAGNTLLIGLPVSAFASRAFQHARPESPSPQNETGVRTPTALLHDAFFKRHDTGSGHPESASRIDAIMQGLRGSRLADTSFPVDFGAVSDDTLLYCHSRAYLEIVKQDITGGKSRLSTGDTRISRDSLQAARMAVGAVTAAVDAVVSGLVGNAFCVVRPPGHHASTDRGMGFCLFNSVAVGARHAQRKHGLARILIVDWDVHHGNGTQEIFYRDGSVFYFSTHQHPWYPGTGREDETGAGAGEGATLNCPLPAGSGRREVLGAFVDQLLPAMKRFKPELVLVSAGFDSRIDDPLGRFRLTDRDFVDLTEIVFELASLYAGERVVSVLEGGYNLEGLAQAVAGHVAALQAGARRS
jgi:acetoin utilization deacetylase AcuC-like enzyme